MGTNEPTEDWPQGFRSLDGSGGGNAFESQLDRIEAKIDLLNSRLGSRSKGSEWGALVFAALILAFIAYVLWLIFA